MNATDFQTADCCATLPRIEPENYESVGTVKKTSKDMKYYESASKVTNKNLAVVVMCDIVGPLNAQTIQQVDRISKGLGALTVMPYWFGYDGGYPGALGSQMNRDDLWKWIGEVAPREKVEERMEDILEVVRKEGIDKIALVGFCWGGMHAVKYATQQEPFIAAASIHGKAFETKDAEQLKIPFMNLASQNEGDQPEFAAAIPPGPIKDAYEFYLFDDVPHGFAAARGDWANNEIHKRRAEEAIEKFASFTTKHAI